MSALISVIAMQYAAVELKLVPIPASGAIGVTKDAKKKKRSGHKIAIYSHVVSIFSCVLRKSGILTFN